MSVLRWFACNEISAGWCQHVVLVFLMPFDTFDVFDYYDWVNGHVCCCLLFVIDSWDYDYVRFLLVLCAVLERVGSCKDTCMFPLTRCHIMEIIMARVRCTR